MTTTQSEKKAAQQARQMDQNPRHKSASERRAEPRRGRITLNAKSTLELTQTVERKTHSPLVPATC
jgi:hypothetical protein